MIQIIPAIDIIEGNCVRLSKGDYDTKKVYKGSPVDMAMRYEDCGVRRIHLVDLDGAKSGSPANLKTLEAIAGKTGIELEWGGGISSDEAIKAVFDAGASQAIIGSVAIKRPVMMYTWLLTYGPEKIILGADVRGRKVAVSGWLENSEADIESLIDSFAEERISQVICTDISRDGMLLGPAFDLYQELQGKYPDIDFTVSGGIGSFADIEKLNGMNLRKVIVGKAIYEGKITLEEIRKWSQNA